MRLRRKPWARPELEACDFYVKEPAKYYGKWKSVFNNDNPIHLELGCGKGGFISKMASQNADINYIGIDIKSEVLVLGKRKIEEEFKKVSREIDNVKIMPQDIERIFLMLSSEDRISRIYINFCNPWPKLKQQKKRLTHTRQLLKYRSFLEDGAQIWFKTDDDDLFDASLDYFKESGFEAVFTTRDLHNSGFNESIPTEHEEMFTQEGIPTKFGIFKKLPDEFVADSAKEQMKKAEKEISNSLGKI